MQKLLTVNPYGQGILAKWGDMNPTDKKVIVRPSLANNKPSEPRKTVNSFERDDQQTQLQQPIQNLVRS